MRSYRCVIRAGACLAVMLGGRVAVAQPTLDEVQRWIDNECRRYSELGEGEPIRLDWESWIPSRVTPAELKAAAESVADHPDHPMRGRIEQHAAQVRDGIRSTRVLIAGDGHFRFQIGYTAPAPDTMDVGVSGNDTWMWNGDNVTIVVTDRPPPMMDYAGMRGEFLASALLLLTGGLVEPRPRHLVWQVTQVQGSVWTARATSKAGTGEEWVHEAVGEWAAGAGRGTLREVRTSASAGLRYTIRASGWSARAPDVWAASEVLLIDATGTVTQRLTLKAVTPLTPDVVRAAVAMPRPGTPDILRGPVEAITVLDERTPGRMVSRATGEGMIEVGPLDDRAARRGRRMWLWGWIAGGGLLAALGVIYWQQARAGRSGGVA